MDWVHIWPNYLSSQLPGPALLQLGDARPGATQGVQYSVSSGTSPPPQNSGTYSWVQLISRYTLTYITETGQITCQPGGFLGIPPPGPPDPNPELDTRYPNFTGNSGEDSPPVPLQPFPPEPSGEGGVRFSATTYLRWTPNADPACTSGAACVVPVPLGSFSWGWPGDATNTLAVQDDGTTWLLKCPTTQPTPGAFIPSIPSQDRNYSYPVWQHRFDGNVYCP
jgi:hypothetical protein